MLSPSLFLRTVLLHTARMLFLMALVGLLPVGQVQAGLNEWTSGGPEGGSIRVVVVDPQTPTTLYAGTPGGVFKSANGGESWSPVNTGLSSSAIRALVVDPQTPTTLYAGTSGGVFVSSNSAGNWTAMNTGLTNTTVRALAVDPQTPTTLYA